MLPGRSAPRRLPLLPAVTPVGRREHLENPAGETPVSPGGLGLVGTWMLKAGQIPLEAPGRGGRAPSVTVAVVEDLFHWPELFFVARFRASSGDPTGIARRVDGAAGSGLWASHPTTRTRSPLTPRGGSFLRGREDTQPQKRDFLTGVLS